MEYKAPRGTKDLFLKEAWEREYLKKTAVEIFENYGYQRIITPTFEETKLFEKGIGEASEIVQKEMYTFTDRKGRSLTLRPEGTAPVVRSYLEHNLKQIREIIKLYYCGSMYRYERPQSGRYREFFQVGVETLGSLDPALDAEIIDLSVRYLKTIGLKKFTLLLNSMGCFKCRLAFAASLKSYLKTQNLCSDCQRRTKINPLRVFDCKKEKCQRALRKAPLISDCLCLDCQVHFREVKHYLNDLKIVFKLAPTLVRGFDYYTKTTFEIQSPLLGAQNALGGGGRYDYLVETYGGPPTPAVGMALGIDRISLVLKNEEVTFEIKPKLDLFLVVIGEDQKKMAVKLLASLRTQGLAAEMSYGQKSLKSQLRLANRLGAAYTLILGPEEIQKKRAIFKDMKSGKEEEISLRKIPNELKTRLASKP